MPQFPTESPLIGPPSEQIHACCSIHAVHHQLMCTCKLNDRSRELWTCRSRYGSSEQAWQTCMTMLLAEGDRSMPGSGRRAISSKDGNHALWRKQLLSNIKRVKVRLNTRRVCRDGGQRDIIRLPTFQFCFDQILGSICHVAHALSPRYKMGLLLLDAALPTEHLEIMHSNAVLLYRYIA